MQLFPNFSETLVSSLSKEEILHRLEKVTKNVNYLDIETQKEDNYKFNGVIQENGFSISLIIKKADSFLPLIKGRIESTKTGIILFLDYTLFPGSVFFLAFWSVICLALSGLFSSLIPKPELATAIFLIGAFNYWFAWAHFKRKVRFSQNLFYELLNESSDPSK